jgi:hypothetical protein
MTKAQKRALVIELVGAWQVPLYLGGWQVKVYFPGRITEVASCASEPEYMTCTLRFNLKRMPDDPAEIRELVCHEMSHPMVEALADLANRGARRNPERKEAIRRAEEILVTTISRMILPHLP